MTSMLYNWQRFLLQCNTTVVSSLFFHSLSFLPSSELLLFVRSFPLPFHALLEDLIGWGHIMHSAKPEQIKLSLQQLKLNNNISVFPSLMHIPCFFFLALFLCIARVCFLFPLFTYLSLFIWVILIILDLCHLLSVVKTHFLISSPGRVILYN